MMGLAWHSALVHLVNTRLHPSASEPILAVWEALLKESMGGEGIQVIFRPEEEYNAEHPWRVAAGQHYRAKILLFSANDERAQTVADNLRRYLAAGERNFALAEPFSFVRETFTLPEPPDCVDIGLNFYTPLYFKMPTKRPGNIQLKHFLTALKSRSQRLFADDAQGLLPDEASLLTTPPVLLPWGLRYQKLMHRSRSQVGTIQWLDGFVGQLVLGKGWQALWPLLHMATQMGAGGRLGFGQGHCTLDAPAKPLLGNPFSPAALERATQQVLDRHDDAAIELAAISTIPFSAERFAQTLAEQLKAPETLAWEPHTAFRVRKENGDRLIEKLGRVELTISYALLDACAPVFEQMFEPDSYGFRPGRSRQLAAEVIVKAIAEGFAFVLESDVAACFPSIRHDLLEGRLRNSLAAADAQSINILMNLVKNAYCENGQIIPRSQGLPQGSPMSPLLSNLVLDCFDERFNGRLHADRFRLVRYADDFVMLTRSKDVAEGLLQEIQAALQALGLDISKEKTSISEIADGFDFLGMHFDANGQPPHQGELHQELLKPFYVTEPGAFLGLNGEALEIRKKGKLLMTRPIARLSEIILLAPVSLSSMLLARLQRQGVCLTLGSFGGRHQGAAMPDSRLFLARSPEKRRHEPL